MVTVNLESVREYVKGVYNQELVPRDEKICFPDGMVYYKIYYRLPDEMSLSEIDSLLMNNGGRLDNVKGENRLIIAEMVLDPYYEYYEG